MGTRLWIFIPLFALLAGFMVVVWSHGRPLSVEPETKRGPVELVYWGVTEPSDAMLPRIRAFEAAHAGIRITYKRQGREEYGSRLSARLAGSAGTPPDLFQWHNTWGPMIGSGFAPSPPDVFSPEMIRQQYYPVVADAVVRGQTVIGVPFYLDGLALVINEDLFDQHDLSPPQTWELFRRAAKTLTTVGEDERILVAGAAIGTTTNVDHWSDILALLFLQNGVDPLAPSGQKAADVLVFYTLFVTADRVWDERLDPSLVSFANGQVAMAFTPSWRLGEIRRAAPNLRMRTVPVPQLPDSPQAVASFWIEGVSARSRFPREAWELLSFLARTDSVYRLATDHANIVGIGFPYPQPAMAPSLADDPLLSAYMQQAPIMRMAPLAYGTKDQVFNDAVLSAYAQAIQSVATGGDPVVAIARLAEQLAPIQSQFGQ